MDAAERIDQLPEQEHEAALAALPSAGRQDVNLALISHAAIVEQMWGSLVAGLPADARTSPPDDPLRGAEQQMADRFNEALRAMCWTLVRAIRGDELDKAEIEATMQVLLAEDDGFREQAETVATYLRAHEG